MNTQSPGLNRPAVAVLLSALVLLMNPAARAAAVGFNIDFAGLHEPSSSFGAAAGQLGYWNNHGSNQTEFLKDLTGVTTGTSITTAGFQAVGNGTEASDFDNLLSSLVLRVSNSIAWSVSIGSVPNGKYRVYIYEPASTISEPGGFFVEGLAVGSFNAPNGLTDFVANSNYKSLLVNVTDNSIDLVQAFSDNPPFQKSFGLAGLQIVQVVPEPVSAALLLLLPACIRRRARPTPSLA